jgi:Ser-tRNA(Ala) deacylase AlaX
MASRPTSGTSSRSSESSPVGGEIRAHSAVHVLKGAVASVMGQRRFTLVGPGTLRFRADAPLAAGEVERIESSANTKISEDAEILEFEMDREEAQAHFGEGIYDLYGPADSTRLKMVRIPDWEASACTRPHVESTGSIGAIKVDSAAFDQRMKEVELRFHLA